MRMRRGSSGTFQQASLGVKMRAAMASAAREAIVIGGGIGGLTTALALLRVGLAVRVFERQPALSEVGAGITLWRNALAALDWVGAGAALAGVGAETAAGVVGTAGGGVLYALRVDAIAPRVARPVLLAFHRLDLQRALCDRLPPGTVAFGAPLLRYEDAGARVRAYFEGHPPADADLLVGADGVASAVRAQLLGDGEPRYAGYTCWRGITATPPDWRGPSGEFWGAGDRFGVVPIGSGRLYWFAVVTAPARASG